MHLINLNMDKLSQIVHISIKQKHDESVHADELLVNGWAPHLGSSEEEVGSQKHSGIRNSCP